MTPTSAAILDEMETGFVCQCSDLNKEHGLHPFHHHPFCWKSRLPALRKAMEGEAVREFIFRHHLERQREWSEKTFGPGDRAHGVVDHIRKELNEIEANPGDLEEWIDVVILALDGAWRSGASPSSIIAKLVEKQLKNENRQWPDWRTAEPGKAIEHVRAPQESEATP